MKEKINHPIHYGGNTPYEAIKVIEAWGCGFHLGNVLKYISRAGKKTLSIHSDLDRARLLEDLRKAQWYLNRKIAIIEESLEKEKNDFSSVG